MEAEEREELLAEAAGLINAAVVSDLAALVETYREQRARERLAPRRRQVRLELERLASSYRAAAQAVDDASPESIGLWLGTAELHGAELARADGLARRADDALAWLNERRPGGGAGTIAHVLGPGARFTLCLHLAHLLERYRPGMVNSSVHGPLYGAAVLLLTAAGSAHPERGLADVLGEVMKAHRHRANQRLEPADPSLSRVA